MKKLLLFIALLALAIPTISLAADLRSTETITKEEKTKNLYLAGQNPTIDADVKGDLVVVGGTVTVNGSVEDSILGAGGTLTLNGPVGGNVRVAGGTLVVESAIAGDLVIFGGDVSIGTKSVVSGDVIVFAGTLNLRGKVLGNVKSTYVGDVTISGNVAGNVEIPNAGTLKVDTAAIIGGTLKYSSEKEGTVASGSKIGAVEYTKIIPRDNYISSSTANSGSILFGALLGFVTLFTLIKLLPKFTKNVLVSSTQNYWAKMGIGLLTAIVTPIVLILLLITFLGWGVMGYLTLAYIIFFALVGPLTALLTGALAWKYFRKEKEYVVNWQIVAIGILLTSVIKIVPLVSMAFFLLTSLLILGTLTTMSYSYLKNQKA